MSICSKLVIFIYVDQLLIGIMIAQYELSLIALILSHIKHLLGLSPLKARHDVTKLDLTIPLLFFQCIDIDLSTQPMSLTLYMTWVHQELHRRYKSWVPCKQISCPQLVHGFGQSSRNCNAPPPNWKDDLSWPSRQVSHGECTSVCDAHWIGPMVNHDARLSIVMIHQATILDRLSTLRGY